MPAHSSIQSATEKRSTAMFCMDGMTMAMRGTMGMTTTATTGMGRIHTPIRKKWAFG
jgi:hypothetical protein